MKKKFGSTVAGASLILSIIALFSKGIGFIREVIYANKFGLSTEYELFLVGAAVPIFINTAIIYLTQNYYIPSYNQALRISKEASLEFFNFTFWWLIIICIFISLLLAALSSIVISFFIGDTSSTTSIIGRKIFLLFILTIPFNAVIAVISAKMQADFKFIYPAVIQIVLNLLVIIFILVFTDYMKIFVLPISFVAAYIISALILIKVTSSEIKFSPKTIFNKMQIYSDYKSFVFLLIIEILSLSYMILDRYFYDVVPDGGIAALNYAIVIFALPISIISLPFVTTVFSKFSQNSNFAQELNKEDYKNALTINNFLMIPISFLMLFGGELFLSFFYEHGQFTSESTKITAGTLNYYTIGLVLYSSYLIVVKYLYSTKLIGKVLFISILAFVLKLVFNLIFVKYLFQDGLALSTSLVYIISFIVGFYFINAGLSFSERSFYLKSLIYFFINSLISLVITFLVVNVTPNGNIYQNIFAGLLFVFIYSMNSFLLKDKEFNLIVETVNKFFSRLRLKF